MFSSSRGDARRPPPRPSGPRRLSVRHTLSGPFGGALPLTGLAFEPAAAAFGAAADPFGAACFACAAPSAGVLFLFLQHPKRPPPPPFLTLVAGAAAPLPSLSESETT